MNINIILKNVQEVITRNELENLAEKGTKIKAYIGFEPSGFVHLGTGLICGNKIKDLAEEGIDVTVLLADWHAYINDKLGGDMGKIRISGEYMKQSFLKLGVPSSVKFIFADELVNRREYWEKVIKVAKRTSLKRVKRAMSIMGRKEDEADLDSSKIIYPFMQVADIFDLDLDIAYGGMDQRHAHMLARELAPKLNYKVPVAIHTPLLPGLQGAGRMDPAEAKMSKSKPNSGINVHDNADIIRAKISKAYCQEKDITNNPLLKIAEYIIFPYYKDRITIKREEKFGGDITMNSFMELEQNFAEGLIHPLDLKNTIADELIEILKPTSDYFSQHMDIIEEMK
jgi:tyrosyl-tRNA synthetase